MICDLEEKRGGVHSLDLASTLFNDTIQDLQLLEIETCNGIHTWNNRRGGQHQMTSNMDQFLIIDDMLNRDVFLESMILLSMGSDHLPIQ